MASITCVALVGCASTGQRLPPAPTANAPMVQRIRYYNHYRAISMEHDFRLNRPVAAPLPTLNLGVSLLANGEEVRSLRQLEPAIAPNSEFARCADGVDHANRSGTAGAVLSTVLIVGGGTVMGVGLARSSFDMAAGGGIAGVIGVIGLPIAIVLQGGFVFLRTRRAMTLYDPLLRRQLGLPAGESTISPEIGPCP